MFRNIILLAALAIALPAIAQPIAAGADSRAGAAATLGDVTTSTTVNLPASLPAPASQEVRHKGLPINSAAPAWATQPVWKCTGAGDAGSFQIKDLGVALSLGGNDKNICGDEFRIAVALNVIRLRIAGDEGYDAARTIACNDDTIANAFEGTLDQCDAPKTKATREARWARERSAAAASGRPVSVAAPAARPMPWQAGG
jgi:hypothetical protein